MTDSSKKLNIDISQFIFFFYLIPFFYGMSIMIILQGSFTHFSTKLHFIGLQARLIGLFFFMASSYVLYVLLYKYPRRIGGVSSIKSIYSSLCKSPFVLIFIISIISPSVLRYFLDDYWRIPYFIVLLACYFIQRKFVIVLKNIYNELT